MINVGFKVFDQKTSKIKRLNFFSLKCFLFVIQFYKINRLIFFIFIMVKCRYIKTKAFMSLRKNGSWFLIIGISGCLYNTIKNLAYACFVHLDSYD